MSDIAIKVENLSKLYEIGNSKSGSIYESFSSLFSKNKEASSFWALNDLTFDINHGDIVGVMGRNGAGKSTLLKVLSRITQPTKGRFTINGRVSSLLEVGTGFHPELSGRENIFLNGTILGMSRSEIRQKMDEIVDFSGVEKFLDTPVKHYSSGMYVRLAFAVAAHLEPEILIIDEVLAVGDATFQKKAIGKMKSVSQTEGRTVLFVSHNIGSIQHLCTHSIVLNQGQMVHSGTTDSGIKYYLSSNQDNLKIPLSERTDRKGNQTAKIDDITINTQSNQNTSEFLSGIKGEFVFKYTSKEPLIKVGLRVEVLNSMQKSITVLNTYHSIGEFDLLNKEGELKCQFDRIPLSHGNYYLNFILISNQDIVDQVESAFSFSIEQSDFFNSGNIPLFKESAILDHTWNIT
ncbi:MAG: ABC transporter ATP-binding protein [Cytophagales bacterium]|nr:ABC transporter ATP-binding protein [Cytophagales bacterium]